MDRFIYLSFISKIAEGLRIGLTKFCGPSKVALLYSLKPDDNIYIFDPQNLLKEHEPKIKELFLEKKIWKRGKEILDIYDHHNWVHFASDLELSGLISFGGWSKSIFYQMWFTQHLPDICSIGPVLRWLENATWVLSQMFALKYETAVENAKIMIQNMVIDSIRDYIVDQRNLVLGPDTELRVYPVLEAIGSISKTKEEGAWARGKLAFIEPQLKKQTKFLISLDPKQRPSIYDFKHVRKLLTAVQGTAYYLISDGEVILGIGPQPLPQGTIWAEFRGSFGYLFLDDDCLCGLEDGHFTLKSRRSKLAELEEILLEKDLSSEEMTKLFGAIKSIVHFAQEMKFGCGLIIDFNDPPLEMAGQKLISPLDLNSPEALILAKSLAKIDGALHIGKDLKLYSFGCLMDGKKVASEDRSRGARYNSALRFTSEHPGVIVVVVSADRPVSVISEGKEIKDRYLEQNINYEDYLYNIRLDQWQ